MRHPPTNTHQLPLTTRVVTHQHDARRAPTPPPASPTSPAQPPWQPAASPTSTHRPRHHQQGRVRGRQGEKMDDGERAGEQIARSCSYSLYIVTIVELLYIPADPYIPT